jgi:hypothetical protein
MLVEPGHELAPIEVCAFSPTGSSITPGCQGRKFHQAAKGRDIYSLEILNYLSAYISTNHSGPLPKRGTTNRGGFLYRENQHYNNYHLVN